MSISSKHSNFFEWLSPGAILTPYPKEFEHIFGLTANDFQRIALALSKEKAHQIIITLKEHHSFFALPDGPDYIHYTGNPGITTGGSGDVLTGILTRLLAQSYKTQNAAVLDVYPHGMTGDKVAGQQFAGSAAGRQLV